MIVPFGPGYIRAETVEEQPDEQPPSEAADSLLDVVVGQLAAHGRPAHRIWLPPLDIPPTLDQLLPPLTVTPSGYTTADGELRGHLRAVTGIVDRPFEQRRDPLWVDLSAAAGHAAVAGAPRSGKSTMLRTLIGSLALLHTPEQVQFYCLDFGGGALAGLDLSLKLTPEQEAARLAAAQARLLHLRLVLGGQIGDDAQLGPPVCVVFEGWDASGKGGAIKRLVAPLDPRHVRVAQFGAPTYDEKRHHFLWRFWPVLPGWGGMAVLDRSWYGRVLVERVEGFAAGEQWRRAYREIVDFERTLADEGMIMVKFWLHLSPAEQLKRFRAREREPLKAWKLTEEDWRNRGKRREYEAAVEQMLDRTDHAAAPWVLVEAEDKRWARVKVVESVVAAIEAGMARRNLPVPPAPATAARAG